jgi:NADH-ubiquinone oxidoreductase chain 6
MQANIILFLKKKMKNFLIDILTFNTLISSILVITSKNPVIAVIFLISVFVNAAGYLILLGIGFIGISYIIVYVRSNNSTIPFCYYDD